MTYLKTALLFIGLFFTIEGNAQSKNSFIVKIDSIEINIYNNYSTDPNHPSINLNTLPKPTLFILNEKVLEISEFSELELPEGAIESIEIINNKNDIRAMGYENYNSIMKIKGKNNH